MRSTYVQGILYPILSDIFFGLLFSLLLKWNWKFFDRSRIFHSSGVPIRLLTTKKSFNHILENIMESPQTTFKRFLMITSSARSNLVRQLSEIRIICRNLGVSCLHDHMCEIDVAKLCNVKRYIFDNRVQLAELFEYKNCVSDSGALFF